MREIKVKYYYTNGVDIFSRIFDMDEDIANWSHWDEISDSAILKKYSILDRVQYTWLKDKNWKEIFEGDVVWDWNDIAWIDSYSKVEYDEEFSWYIVYTPWLITPLHEALEVWNGRDATTWKDICWVYVVWNIYENSNLLNKD